jgi:hypothetical protein
MRGREQVIRTDLIIIIKMLHQTILISTQHQRLRPRPSQGRPTANRYIPWWNETALRLIEPSKSVLEEGPPGSARSETKRPGKAILIVATIASDRFDHQT